jgi:hypothetical protein
MGKNISKENEQKTLTRYNVVWYNIDNKRNK